MKTISQMKSQLKKAGLWISSIESFGAVSYHSYWFVYWNDRDHPEHIHTDGTDGGSTKAWQKRLAIEKAIEIRWNEIYKAV